METQVRTPQSVFMQPQRLVVPLFQRPYVWNEENQWAPLWRDLVRVAERLLNDPGGTHQPHFLGAVVLQQLANPVGSLQTRTVIDGQQRLTTLQIMLDAMHAVLGAVGAAQPALRLEALVKNPEAFCDLPEDQFKVWPTNRDRGAFNDVMAPDDPVDYETLEFAGSRLVNAHKFFAESVDEWLNLNGTDEVLTRAEQIEKAARDLLQLVVIDLAADENAQEIFETLNARGAHLTAADLIKNFVFQRLMEEGADVEGTYEEYWRDFETGFWETEVSFGRLKYSRSSIFMNHWLISQTGEEIVAREVFTRFKHYADFEAEAPMSELVQRIARSSSVYREFIEGASASNPIDRIQLFAYRSGTMDSEVFKPVLLWLLDPERPPVDPDQLRRSIEILESWLVRRMLVRAQTGSYAQVAAELITQLGKHDRQNPAETLETYFVEQNVAGKYLPDNDEVTNELRTLLAYKQLRRGRLRMVLEAVEDHRRGWRGTTEGLGGERVARNAYHIEHVIPRTWEPNWPLEADEDQYNRDRAIHTLGNLTLLTGKLNSKVSNSAWLVKRDALQNHDVLKLNSDLLASAAETWSIDKLKARTDKLISDTLTIWSVPEGHESGFSRSPSETRKRAMISDLVSSGLVEPGTTIRPRRESLEHLTATVLPDGRIDVDGVAFEYPSGAAKAITGKNTNGWWFFVIDGTRTSFSDLLQVYVDQTAASVEEESDDSDDEEEDVTGY